MLAGCERWPRTSRARQVIDFADGLAESVLEKEQGINLDESLRTAMMEEAERAPLFDSLLQPTPCPPV